MLPLYANAACGTNIPIRQRPCGAPPCLDDRAVGLPTQFLCDLISMSRGPALDRRHNAIPSPAALLQQAPGDFARASAFRFAELDRLRFPKNPRLIVYQSMRSH